MPTLAVCSQGFCWSGVALFAKDTVPVFRADGPESDHARIGESEAAGGVIPCCIGVVCTDMVSGFQCSIHGGMFVATPAVERMTAAVSGVGSMARHRAESASRALSVRMTLYTGVTHASILDPVGGLKPPPERRLREALPKSLAQHDFRFVYIFVSSRRLCGTPKSGSLPYPGFLVYHSSRTSKSRRLEKPSRWR